MRVAPSQLVISLLLAASASLCGADVKPETVGTTTLAAPEASWILLNNSFGPTYVMDSASGDMLGLLSLSEYTPALEVNMARKEIYAAERYYSRKYHGERTDLLTVYDFAGLAPIAEIDLPDKIASLAFPQFIALMDDTRHLAVFNMTPAQSVSIVDIRRRTFIGEISTPGCALIMPVAKRRFMQICGDGTLQLIGLNGNGAEASRTRSASFFGIDEDPVFDKPVATRDGWLMVSFAGRIFDASVSGDQIIVSAPWSVLTEDDVTEKWRPGGGQLLAYQETLGLIYLLMHQGGEDTHEDAGTEIWVLDRGAQRRIARIALPAPSMNVYVSGGAEPFLNVSTTDRKLQVFDARTTRLLRTVEEVGPAPGLMRGFD